MRWFPQIKKPMLENTMFLQGTYENEILSIIKKFKSKKSADSDGLDVSLERTNWVWANSSHLHF